MSTKAVRPRRFRRWIIGGGAVVIVLAVGGPFVFIHFIEGSSPKKLSLPVVSSTTTTPSAPGGTVTPSGAAAATTAAVSGTLHVGAGSEAGYRVQETLLGQKTTAVGRTTEISGSIVIAGTKVTTGSFVVNMASVKSDQSERNAQFDGRIMDVSAYPTATFRLTSPIELGTIPAVGVQHSYQATGTLDMHGVTTPITFPVAAERTGSGVDLLAEIPIQFSTWHIANPSVGGFVTTASNGTLEVLLVLTKGSGNAAVTGGSAAATGGFGGPVTVPATTVPALDLPKS